MRALLRMLALSFCCYIGGMAGTALSMATIGRWTVERIEAKHPGEHICGLAVLPHAFLGLVGGIIAGGLAYWWINRRLNRSCGQLTG